jgi:uncharacterized protein YndB with AHSA1/START domain
MSDRIEKTIELKAPIERVWRALTDHSDFGEWFRVKLDGPFVPGKAATGRITYPGYEHLKWEVKVNQMDAPRLFSFTWQGPVLSVTTAFDSTISATGALGGALLRALKSLASCTPALG